MMASQCSQPSGLTAAEMLAILERSGYLFESEVSRHFVDRGYFVETNQVLKDSFTGKSRELDLLAQHNFIDPACGEMNAYSKVHLVCEVKNNLYPVVLMTPYTFSPYGDERGGLKQGQTGEGFLKDLDIDYYLTQWTSKLSNITQFTQYCSFQRKNNNNKNELMAIHPEELYAGLSKITQACEESVDSLKTDYFRNHLTDRTHRNHLYLPVLIIKDELYELHSGSEDQHDLRKVRSSRLYFSYYHSDEPRTALVYVVTKAGLDEFIDCMMALERDAFDYLINGLRNRID
jgi:hypothetical protein